MGQDLSKPPPPSKPQLVPPPPSPPKPPQPPLPPPPSPSSKSPPRPSSPPSKSQPQQLPSPKSQPSLSPDEDVKKPSSSLPLNLQHILKDADSPIDASSHQKLYDQLYSGVFLHHNTKKYWLNRKSNCNSFMLYARALSIKEAENQSYWRWVSIEESSGTMIEVAELSRVSLLEVQGRLDTRKLSPGILYEVSFHVMLKDTAQGWEVPINMRLVLPGGKKQEHKENFKDKPREVWTEIPVGRFVASADEDGGEMEFSMYDYESGIWKQGLLIKAVSINPNPGDYCIAL